MKSAFVKMDFMHIYFFMTFILISLFFIVISNFIMAPFNDRSRMRQVSGD